MKIEFIDSITAISAAQWNAIAGTDYPFTRHEFLHILESSGCTNSGSGWQPQHVLVKRGNDVIAVMPLYLKYHSYGEYVFDWSWADAYRRHGLQYYPKMLCAIPFTPATGPRLCVAPAENCDDIAAQVIAALRRRIDVGDLSSLHILFPQPELSNALKQAGLSERLGVQYHWFNRKFSSFDDFLATFNSRKRKNLRKERARIAEQELQLRTIEGENITADHWRLFHRFYELTYAKRSGHGGYLNAQFFQELGRQLSEHMMMTLAYWRDEAIAGALYFRGGTTLYGRYWGCVREFDCLHFEACYYQGIEYCIRNGLQHFDPGAQGEHKIQRGFVPIETFSYHWIKDRAFRGAIDDFIQREHLAIAEHITAAADLLPFKRSGDN
ncbi:MAG TPA: GNAT family N-acetyltransferase [Spongiibacteraceae bacterium]